MPFSGMIKLKLKFFKSMWHKITKSIIYFSFILKFKKQKKFNRERRRKKKEKEEKKRKDKKKID